MFVHCPCGEDHYTGTIEAINIEEDIYGRDVLTYVCPVLGDEMKALVLVDMNTSMNEEYWKTE